MWFVWPSFLLFGMQCLERSNTEAPDFKDNNTPTVEGNNDAGKTRQ